MLTVLLAVALNVAPPSPAPPVPLGPPTLCHPLDIGSSASLPWAGGAFGVDADYDIKNLAGDTYEILLRSEDPLVHVETLRRAVVYATGMGERRERPSQEQREAILAALFEELQFDTDVHEPAARAARSAHASGECPSSAGAEKAGACKPSKQPPAGTQFMLRYEPRPALGGRQCQAQSRNAGLCFLDVGFLSAALREAGFPRHDDGSAALRDALALLPSDPAVRLGAALGLVSHPDAATREEAWRHLDTAVALIEDAPARDHLRKNLLATVGPLLDAKNHDELVQGIREHAAQS